VLSYGEILRKTLKAEGHNLTSFAESINISREHLTGIVNGSTLPSFQLHKRICAELKLSEEFYKATKDVECQKRFIFKETQSSKRCKHSEHPRGKAKCKKD